LLRALKNEKWWEVIAVSKNREIKLRAESLGIAFKNLALQGGNGIRVIYFHLGFQMGLVEGRNISSTRQEDFHVKREAFVRELERVLTEQGFGEVKVMNIDLFRREIRIRVYNGFESDFMKPSREPTCLFTRGYLEGLIEGLTGLKIRESLEIKCRAVGDPYCEMLFCI